MRYELPAKNWTTELANFIDQAQDGDVIVVFSEDVKELAEIAKARMYPDKQITFEVQEEVITFIRE